MAKTKASKRINKRAKDLNPKLFFFAGLERDDGQPVSSGRWKAERESAGEEGPRLTMRKRENRETGRENKWQRKTKGEKDEVRRERVGEVAGGDGE